MYTFQVNSWAAMANLIAIPLTYFFAYNFGHTGNKKLQLFSRPRIYRVGFVGGIKCFTKAIISFDRIIFQDGYVVFILFFTSVGIIMEI